MRTEIFYLIVKEGYTVCDYRLLVHSRDGHGQFRLTSGSDVLADIGGCG